MIGARKQSHWSRRRTLSVVAVVSVIAAAAIVALARLPGESGRQPSLAELVRDVDPGPVHVHGLGVNPTDGSLFVATHTGMYRVGVNEENATLVGKSRQDTMGFTVVGPNRFFGSGHPDPADAGDLGLPPLLGLIESRDAGRTWRTISLAGRADFHVLRVFGRRVYGYDASNDRLLVSMAGGRSWRRVGHPGPLVDLAVDPRNPQRLLATTENGLFSSTNHGGTWRPLAAQAGLLAWPSSSRIYFLSGSGQVFAGRELRGRWVEVGNTGGPPAAFVAQTADRLFVALHDGTIRYSANGGRAWRTRSRPQ